MEAEMTANPFEEIMLRLERIEAKIGGRAAAPAADPVEKPIDTEQLCEFLGVTRPTIVRYRKKNIIPFLLIGSSIRYDRRAVLKALEAKKERGRR
jgi:excisionase family DNA binding protein